MLYDYLEEFAVIGQAGSLSIAAKELGVSQSTLSRHLASLEAELGMPLVVRTASGFVLTDAGRTAFESALDIASLTASVARHYNNVAKGRAESRLRVGLLVDSSSAQTLIDRACLELSETGGAAVTARFLRPRAIGDISEPLRRREVDVLICFSQAYSVTAKDIVEVPFSQVNCAISVNPHEALTSLSSVAVQDLRDMAFACDVDDASGPGSTWQVFRSACLAQGVVIQARALYRSTGYGFEIPRSDEAIVCVADGAQVDAQRQTGRVIVPVEGIKLPLACLIRADDADARRVVELAGELAHKPSIAAATHESLYGSTSRALIPPEAITPAQRDEAQARVAQEPPVISDVTLPDGTIVDKVYVALRNRLNRIGDGLSNDPVATSYEAIMHLWSLDDARFELQMPMMRWFSAYELSQQTDSDPDECEKHLEDMASRGLIYASQRGGVRRYSLAAWVYGIWEAAVSDYTSENLRWGILGSDVGSGSQYPAMMTCPVDAHVVREGRVAAFRDWQAYIHSQTIACVAPCQCRRAFDILHPGESSGKGSEEVCLTFGEMAQYWINRGAGRAVSIGKALDIAKTAVFDNGFVPQMYYSRNPEVLCFCNSRCCLTLGAIRAAGGITDTMDKVSVYRLVYTKDSCLSCGACVQRCPMQAITLTDEGICEMAPTCVACGQCALVCPAGARTLELKHSADPTNLPEDIVQSNAWRSADRMARGLISDFTGTRIDTWTGVQS